MTRHSKPKEGTKGVTVLLLGALASGVIFTALSLAAAFISYSMNDPTSAVGIFSIAVLMITGAICGFGISKIKGDGGIVISLLSALLFTLVLLLIGLIAGGGKISFGSIINYICYIAIAVLFAFFGKKRERRHKRR